MKMSPEKQRLGVVGLLLLWCVALVGYRNYLASDALFVGLLWNLFLAAVPLFWGAAFQAASERKRPFLAAIAFGLWLLFLPNAPYILTDLIHLAPRDGVPFWFILAMLLSCAGTGTLLGYFSLLPVHTVIEERFGKIIGWLVAGGSLLLCGFGIYVGRFLRWNSWNALTDPFALFHDSVGKFVDPGAHPHPIGVTVVFGVGLMIGYLALRSLTAPSK